jgi:hypothetical protein
MPVSLINLIRTCAMGLPQAIKDPKIVDRVHVASNRQRQGQDQRPFRRLIRNQPRPQPGRIQIVDDCERLVQPTTVDLKRRDQALGVDVEIVRALLVVAAEVDHLPLVLHALQIERDAHPIAR